MCLSIYLFVCMYVCVRGCIPGVSIIIIMFIYYEDTMRNDEGCGPAPCRPSGAHPGLLRWARSTGCTAGGAGAAGMRYVDISYMHSDTWNHMNMGQDRVSHPSQSPQNGESGSP